MPLRHRSPAIDSTPAVLTSGLDHLDQRWVAVLRWLNAARLDYVLVGPVAHAIRGELTARGAVAVVPAPYRRNLERLAAMLDAHAAARRESAARRAPATRTGVAPAAEEKLTADTFAAGGRCALRVGGHELDVEGSGGGLRYQELLYESARMELAPGIAVEVASPEDLEHYSHLRRTGAAPEFRISRGAGTAPDEARPATARRDSPAGS